MKEEMGSPLSRSELGYVAAFRLLLYYYHSSDIHLNRQLEAKKLFSEASVDLRVDYVTAGVGSLLIPLYTAPSGQGTIEIISKASEWEIACSIIMAVAMVIAVGIAAYSVHIAKSSARMSQYAYLANKWYELKEKEFDNPGFAEVGRTQSYETAFTGQALKQYESFAWMCWGYAEDVFVNHFHEDQAFNPTIRRCKSLHYTWLTRDRFGPNFLAYIKALQ